MYIVNMELPTSCNSCPFAQSCSIWENYFLEYNGDILDPPVPRPMQYKGCKIKYVMPRWIEIFFKKWILRQCPHICKLCKYRKVCDIGWKLQ